MSKRLIRLGKEKIDIIVDNYEDITEKYLKISKEKNLIGIIVMKTIGKYVYIFVEIDNLDEYSKII